MGLLRDLWATSPGRTAAVACLLLLAGCGQAAAPALSGAVLLHRSPGHFAALAAALVVAVAGDLAVGLVTAGLTTDWATDVRRRLCRVAFGQDLPALEATPAGELLDRVDGDVQQVASELRGTWVRLAQSLVLGVLSVVTTSFVWWPAGLVMVGLAALLAVCLRGRARRIAEARAAQEEAWSDLAAVVEEAVHGQDDVRAGLAQPYVLRLCARRARRVLVRGRRVWSLSARVTATATGVVRCGVAAVVLGGVAALAAGRVDAAQLTSVWLLAIAFGGIVEHVSRTAPRLEQALGAWERLRSLRSAPQEPSGGAEPADGDLVVRGLTFRYPGDGRGPALRDVDLTFVRGRSYALVGRTGAGKSTLARVLTRTVDVPRGAVRLGGADLVDLDVDALRRWIGLVPQRTEILAGTLAENITLFDDRLLPAVPGALAELGLTAWAAGLPAGLGTRLGEDGHVLSAGQEQLLAFARLLVRDPRVVVLDEATARLDPVTEARVQRAGERLLRHRIGIVIAHRPSSVRRCDEVVVLADGRVVEAGPLRGSERFARLLDADGPTPAVERGGPIGQGARAEQGTWAQQGARTEQGTQTEQDERTERDEQTEQDARTQGDERTERDEQTEQDARTEGDERVEGDVRTEQDARAEGGAPDGRCASQGPPAARRVDPPPMPEPPPARTLREVFRLSHNDPRYGTTGVLLFLGLVLLALDGPVPAWLWADVSDGRGEPFGPALVITAVLLATTPLSYWAGRWYPEWWARQVLRVSLRLVHGQTGPRRVGRHPAADVVAHGGDAGRAVVLADGLHDHLVAVLAMVAMTVVSGSWAPAAFFGGTMVLAGLSAALFGPALGRRARRTVAARAAFATALGSALSAARAVKLAGATGPVLAHLARLDGARGDRSRREVAARLWAGSTASALSGLLPIAAWALYLSGDLSPGATLVAVAVLGGARWFASTTASLVSQVRSAGVWTARTAAMTGTGAYSAPVPGVDLAAGVAPEPPALTRQPLHRLELVGFGAVHDDGTVGVRGVDLTVTRGQLVLVVGRVGAGKSSLLRALAGLVRHTGSLRWDGEPVRDPELFLRPARVGYVAQQPRVLSGTVADNIHLGREVDLAGAVTAAQLDHDLAVAGRGTALPVGHRGVRLSGGQLQRLALARALAPRTELLVVDDVSSALDPATELDLWRALRARGTTVIGSTSKRAALVRADTVLVLCDGVAVAAGPWARLADRWGHLAG